MLLDESDALCLVCQEVLKDPVHVVCQKACGVKLCGGCWESYSLSQGGRPRCALCRSLVFPDLTARDRTLGGLLVKFERECCYGCGERSLHEEMSSHELVCGERPVVCPNAGCRAPLKAKDLDRHVSECLRSPCDDECETLSFGRCHRLKVGCPYVGTLDKVRKHRSVCLHHRFRGHVRGMYSKIRRLASDARERLEAEAVADAWE